MTGGNITKILRQRWYTNTIIRLQVINFVLYIISKANSNIEQTLHKTDPESSNSFHCMQQLTCIFWHALPPHHRRMDYPNDLFKLAILIFCEEQVSTRPKPTNSGTWTFSKLVASPPSCTCILHRFNGFYEPAGKYINILQNRSQTLQYLCGCKKDYIDVASNCHLQNANQVGN